MKASFLVINLVIVFQLCLAQQSSKEVRGVIQSADGKAIPGVLIKEKDGLNQTLSDSVGFYSITVPNHAILVFSQVGYQLTEIKVSDLTIVDVKLIEESVEDFPINIGYGSNQSSSLVGSVVVRSNADFNKGNIYAAPQLWQGRVPGLSVYHRGSDPNTESVMRIRGLTTFDPEATPLIVIDGVPQASMNNLDPVDIESITVLKDGAAAAIYGMRGSNGVILIKTRQGSSSKPLSLSFQSELAISTVKREQPVFNAQEYVNVGGNDLGSNTNWQRAITSAGISNNQHLTLSASEKNSSIYISTHLRNVNGILMNSGFDQVNTRVQASHRTLDDRLQINFNMAVTNRNTDYSFPEAFRYANFFNPTAPIKFDNGSYYQAVLFDNYNPVALIKQNTSVGKSKLINYGGSISFDISKNLRLTTLVAQQSTTNFTGAYYSRESFYLGLNRGGLAQRYSDEKHFTFAESYLSYHATKGNTRMDFVGGFSYQQDHMESFGAQLGNFPNDKLGYDALQYSADIISGLPNLIKIYSTSTPNNKIQAGFLRANVGFGRAVSLQGSVRYEGSSKLGSNKKWGLFSSLGTNVNMLQVFKSLGWHALNLRMSYGTTGAIPTQSGLSVEKYEYNLNNGGTLVKVQDGNPNLKWEQKQELNVGVDFQMNSISGSIDAYQRVAKDIISLINIKNVNAAALKGRGIELLLQYNPQFQSSLRWSPSLVVNMSSTRFKKYPGQKELRGNIDGPCGCGTLPIKIEEGEKIGQIWSPVYNGVGSNGRPIFKDSNGDGILTTSPYQALDPLTDFRTAGYGIPSIELGWGNLLEYRNWQLNAFFRGAFGHSLLNVLRMMNEPLDPGAINSYNRIKTDKAVPGLTSSEFNSLYVEKAGFLTLDNISIRYQFNVSNRRYIKSFQLYGTAQNLFTITKYSGVDPEPALMDKQINSANWSIPADALISGFDRNFNYLPARTFLIGFSIGI